MTDTLPYRHADGAHEAGMALWPDDQELQLLPANVNPLMETTLCFNPYINAQAAVGVLSAELGFTNTMDFQGFNLEGLITPQDQGHRGYPNVTGETGFHKGGGDDDLLNRNEVIEQPNFHTANNVQVLSPPLSQATSSSPLVRARPSEVDIVKSPSTRGRRYTCQPCSFSSNIKRDFKRHQNTRKHQSNATRSIATLDVTGEPILSSATGWPCPVQNCKFSDASMMFTREDNLMRHIRKEHVHGTEAKKQTQH